MAPNFDLTAVRLSVACKELLDHYNEDDDQGPWVLRSEKGIIFRSREVLRDTTLSYMDTSFLSAGENENFALVNGKEQVVIDGITIHIGAFITKGFDNYYGFSSTEQGMEYSHLPFTLLSKVKDAPVAEVDQLRWPLLLKESKEIIIGGLLSPLGPLLKVGHIKRDGFDYAVYMSKNTESESIPVAKLLQTSKAVDLRAFSKPLKVINLEDKKFQAINVNKRMYNYRQAEMPVKVRLDDGTVIQPGLCQDNNIAQYDVLLTTYFFWLISMNLGPRKAASFMDRFTANEDGSIYITQGLLKQVTELLSVNHQTSWVHSKLNEAFQDNFIEPFLYPAEINRLDKMGCLIMCAAMYPSFSRKPLHWLNTYTIFSSLAKSVLDDTAGLFKEGVEYIAYCLGNRESKLLIGQCGITLHKVSEEIPGEVYISGFKHSEGNHYVVIRDGKVIYDPSLTTANPDAFYEKGRPFGLYKVVYDLDDHSLRLRDLPELYCDPKDIGWFDFKFKDDDVGVSEFLFSTLNKSFLSLFGWVEKTVDKFIKDTPSRSHFSQWLTKEKTHDPLNLDVVRSIASKTFSTIQVTAQSASYNKRLLARQVFDDDSTVGISEELL